MSKWREFGRSTQRINVNFRFRHGLLTTLAYQQEGHKPTYALEGSVAVAGLALR